MDDARDDEVSSDVTSSPKDATVQPARQPRRIRRFQEVDRWCHDNHLQKQIDGLVRGRNCLVDPRGADRVNEVCLETSQDNERRCRS